MKSTSGLSICPKVGRQRCVTPLPLGEDGVERERGRDPDNPVKTSARRRQVESTLCGCVRAHALDDQAVSHAVPLTETHLAGQGRILLLCARTDNHQGTGPTSCIGAYDRANDDDAGAAGAEQWRI